MPAVEAQRSPRWPMVSGMQKMSRETWDHRGVGSWRAPGVPRHRPQLHRGHH